MVPLPLHSAIMSLFKQGGTRGVPCGYHWWGVALSVLSALGHRSNMDSQWGGSALSALEDVSHLVSQCGGGGALRALSALGDMSNVFSEWRGRVS